MRRAALMLLLACLLFPVPAPGKQPAGERAARVLLTKSDRSMYLFDAEGNVLRRYKVSLGKNPVGNKEYEGDNRTPEGRYIIDARNENSQYYLSLRISYPAQADRQRARRRGLSPGGDIFIHGMPNGKEWMTWKYNKNIDWTNGCIAVSNAEIREMWDMIPDGTPILILP